MRVTIRLGQATYRATLRDLAHVWAGDMPAWNYSVKRTAQLTAQFATLGL